MHLFNWQFYDDNMFRFQDESIRHIIWSWNLPSSLYRYNSYIPHQTSFFEATLLPNTTTITHKYIDNTKTFNAYHSLN